MAQSSLLCADMPLRNYSLAHFVVCMCVHNVCADIVTVWNCLFVAADHSFQTLVILFFLKHSQSDALSNAVRQLTSHITAASEASDDASEQMFDMECQDLGTHVAGCPSIQEATEKNASVSLDEQTANERSSPVFGRRGIHDVKPTASLRALHAYDGCDQDDESEDPLASNAAQLEEIVVPIGFNSQIIKYVNYMHCLLMVDSIDML